MSIMHKMASDHVTRSAVDIITVTQKMCTFLSLA